MNIVNKIISLSIPLFLLTFCANSNEEDPNIEHKHTNNLINESSPYLLEHAHNPVDWYPWGDEALEKAQKENKPLIISIGYAACHWCHVMERESFSDPEVAEIMNEKFVSIKVDREERPDIDNIYMNAAQMLTGRGGWPLNAIALPDGRPFFVGTYFPKEQWVGLLQQIDSIYKNDYEKVVEQADNITHGLQTQELVQLRDGDTVVPEGTYEKLYSKMEQYIDKAEGGFGSAPKFPMPVIWEFLIQNYYISGNDEALKNTVLTLDKMAAAGIYDQIGGGFHRYATDGKWMIPHFEKMLYDNGQLISLYSNAYKVTEKTRYKEIVEESIDFVVQELMDESGGFYSSLNADSEGEEGKYYVWKYNEVKEILDDDEFDIIEKYYQLKEDGNWEEGKNILDVVTTKQDFIDRRDEASKELRNTIKEANEKLFRTRKKRVMPSLDDKVITSWNALMLRALIDAYRAFENEEYLKLALKNANFISDNMISVSWELKRIYKNGKTSISAFLDDYSLLAEAYLELYQVTFDKKWLDKADKLVEYSIEHFKHEETSFFYYTSDSAENLAARKMELQDNVIPASNSVMATVLYKLGEMQYNTEYIETAEKMAAKIVSSMNKSPAYHSKWAMLIGLIEDKMYDIAITGENSVQKALEMQKDYLPTSIFLGGRNENLPLLKGKLNDETTIYVCKDRVCKMPVTDVSEAMKQVGE